MNLYSNSMHAMRRFPETHAWLEAIPDLVETAKATWNLTVDGPPLEAGISCVLPVTQNGIPLILKIQWPHKECLTEAPALQAWDGVCAPHLVAWDEDNSMLLMERIKSKPLDMSLFSLADATAELVPQMNVPTSYPFDALETDALTWVSGFEHAWEAQGKPFDKGILNAAISAGETLAATQTHQVLIHQDLHEENILFCSTRDRLIAIDPKPLIGEWAFGVSRAIMNSPCDDSHAKARVRVDFLSAALSLDKDRVRGWALVKALNVGLSRATMPEDCARVATWMARELS